LDSPHDISSYHDPSRPGTGTRHHTR
jgi:hypothetical protein